MQAVRPRWSFADLERMPDDGRRYELYDGELWEVPGPIPRHQRVTHKIASVLEDYGRAVGGLMFQAPIDIVLTEYNVVQPDIVFFTSGRVGSIDMRKAIRVPPDLAVEVLSPGTASTDRGQKPHLLARFGVREYWLVDPLENTIERYGLTEGAYVLDAVVSERDVMSSQALEGLQFAADRIFAR